MLVWSIFIFKKDPEWSSWKNFILRKSPSESHMWIHLVREDWIQMQQVCKENIFCENDIGIEYPTSRMTFEAT